MAAEVFMPKAGMDMQEGTIIRWLVEVGDEVRAQEPLLEIETDKVTMEVEAPADGVLLVKYFDDGAVVPVVTIIGYVGEKGEKVPDRPAMAGGQARAVEAETLRAPKREREFEYGVAVIGGGPAGYVAALSASRMGAKTILFEAKKLGGTCTNAGCIPTKTYVQTAHDLLRTRKALERGIVTGAASVDMEA
ncbi:MAG: biotin/lipoyl-containing protein, partial [bacterium]